MPIQSTSCIRDIVNKGVMSDVNSFIHCVSAFLLRKYFTAGNTRPLSRTEFGNFVKSISRSNVKSSKIGDNFVKLESI